MSTSTSSQPNTKRTNIIIENGGDRISNLPEEVLYHILSFLPTKYAARTSVLSKKWEYLWTSTPNLDFDDEFLASGPPNCSTLFVNFINRVFILRGASHSHTHMHKFRLKSRKSYNSPNVNTWIASAVMCNVHEIDLSIDVTYTVTLPRCLFTCNSLVVLKLCILELQLPSSIFLPNLKVLHLVDTTLSHGFRTGELFSGCPVLEELKLGTCFCLNFPISISSPTLKRLTISRLIHITDVLSVCRIGVDAPSLEYFKYKSYLPYSMSFGNLPSLVEAFFDIKHQKEASEEAYESLSHFFCKLLRDFAHAKVLTLSHAALKILAFSVKNHRIELPTFSNLKHLELKICGNPYSSWILPDLLELSPNLVSLVFPKGCEFHLPNYFNGKVCSSPGVLLHLKIVKLMDFHWNVHELELVYFLLKYASFLEHITIASSESMVVDTHKESKSSRKYSKEESLGAARVRYSLPYLKVVDMRNFNGCVLELELVESLLHNARALERMKISCSKQLVPGTRNSNKIQKKIQKLQKVSTSMIEYS